MLIATILCDKKPQRVIPSQPSTFTSFFPAASAIGIMPPEMPDTSTSLPSTVIGNDALFHMVRILDGHMVSRTAEISSGGKAVERGRNTRIDHQSVIIRADTQNILGDVKECPCSRSGQPAVLGFTEVLGVLAGDHL